MHTRKLSKNLSVSEIGYGAWAIGGAMWGGARDEDSAHALDRAVSNGVDFIDTALVYGQGHSERLVGACLKRHPGKRLKVATKVPGKAFQWPARPDAKLGDFFPTAWVVECCDKSLKNLGVERIDLLQLHVWADAWTEEDEWYEAMTRLREQGKIDAIGISINSHDPASAVRVVESGRVDALQVFYNVFDQSPEDVLFPACQKHGVGVIARVPFDEGSLTGKLKKDTKFPAGDFRAEYFAGDLLPQTVDRVEKMRPILESVAGSMAQGALRFCLSHPAVSTVIPGMRTDAQVDQNTGASDVGPLDATTLAALRAHRWVRAPY